MYATVQLSCANNEDTRYCINDDVQYQCSISGSDVSLRWRVFNSSNAMLRSTSYSTGEDIKG